MIKNIKKQNDIPEKFKNEMMIIRLKLIEEKQESFEVNLNTNNIYLNYEKEPKVDKKERDTIKQPIPVKKIDKQVAKEKEQLEKKQKEAEFNKEKMDFLNNLDNKANNGFEVIYKSRDAIEPRKTELFRDYKEHIDFIDRFGINLKDEDSYFNKTYKFRNLTRPENSEYRKKIYNYYLYCREKDEQIIDQNYLKAIDYFKRNYAFNFTSDKSFFNAYYTFKDANCRGRIEYDRDCTRRVKKFTDEQCFLYKICQLDNMYGYLISRNSDSYNFPPLVKFKYNIYMYFMYDVSFGKDLQFVDYYELLLKVPSKTKQYIEIYIIN